MQEPYFSRFDGYPDPEREEARRRCRGRAEAREAYLMDYGLDNPNYQWIKERNMTKNEWDLNVLERLNQIDEMELR